MTSQQQPKSVLTSNSNFKSLFAEAEKKYLEYLNNSKKYHLARDLWKTNEELYVFAKEIRNTLSPEEKFHIDLLIAHLDSWRKQWLKLESVIHPDLNTVFSFTSEVPFPKESKFFLSKIRLGPSPN